MDRDLCGKASHRQPVQYQREIKARKHLCRKSIQQPLAQLNVLLCFEQQDG